MGDIKSFDQLAAEMGNEYDSQVADEKKESASVQTAKEYTEGDVENQVSIVLMENNSTISLKGLSMRGLLNELSKPIIYALNKNKINSIGAQAFGDLVLALGSPPEGMKRVSYDWCGKDFFVLKNSKRESMIYDAVISAANMSSGDVFFFPFAESRLLEIDARYGGVENKEASDLISLEIDYLTFTEEELKGLNYAFIKKISLTYDSSSNDPYKEARIVFTVDKKLLETAPFAR